eukprot:6313399-Amphidinium_carterae.1
MHIAPNGQWKVVLRESTVSASSRGSNSSRSVGSCVTFLQIPARNMVDSGSTVLSSTCHKPPFHMEAFGELFLILLGTRSNSWKI